jgi:uncharacterized LabA/DUF88 family protein
MERVAIIKRIYAFIDSQNLNLGVSRSVPNSSGGYKYLGWNLDFEKFYYYLKRKYYVSKAFLFIGEVVGRSNLYSDLQSYGYEVQLKQTTSYIDSNGDLKIKGNVDAELVLSVATQINNYDEAIIVSGDGDYACLLEFLVKEGKLGKVLIPNRYSYSKLYNPYRQYFRFVSDLEPLLKK